MGDINVVPYIDVMLVLLVIFMITAPLLNQGVNVDLPQAKAKVLSAEQEPIIVSVNKRGQYFLNIAAKPSEPITSSQLVEAVQESLTKAKQKGVNRPVLVNGDRAASYGDIVKAMVILQQAGVPNVGLMTQET
jgi:biopolymer transport protein TolR